MAREILKQDLDSNPELSPSGDQAKEKVLEERSKESAAASARHLGCRFVGFFEDEMFWGCGKSLGLRMFWAWDLRLLIGGTRRLQHFHIRYIFSGFSRAAGICETYIEGCFDFKLSNLELRLGLHSQKSRRRPKGRGLIVPLKQIEQGLGYIIIIKSP